MRSWTLTLVVMALAAIAACGPNLPGEGEVGPAVEQGPEINQLTFAVTSEPQTTRTAYNYAYTKVFAHLPGDAGQSNSCGFVQADVYVYDRLITKGNDAPVAYTYMYALLEVDYCDKPIVKYHGSAVLAADNHQVNCPKQGGKDSEAWTAWLKKPSFMVWNQTNYYDRIWVNFDLQWAGSDTFYYYGSHTKVAGELTTNGQTDWTPSTLSGAMTATGAVGNLTFGMETQKLARIVDTANTVHAK